jgi:hypothetical protein
MTVEQVLTDFPMLTAIDIANAFDSAKRKISLQPMLVSCVANNVYNKALVGPENSIVVDGAPYVIKEIKEVMTETPIYNLNELEITDDPESTSFSFKPLNPLGKVYYNNNSFSCSSASFNLICYIYPHITTAGRIPDGFILITIAKAMANHCLSSRDIAGASQYEAIYYGLINHLNQSLQKIMPQSWCELGELVTNEL